MRGGARSGFFGRRGFFIGAPAAMLVAAVVLALVASLVPMAKASAYYGFDTVGVSTGSAYLTVQEGSSASTSVTVTPSSDSQTLGCGMAKCPQVCMTDDAIEAGYSCFDANGQCTCSGPKYSTYYPEVSASSSNSGVATAYVSGGTLVVTGHSAGSATITVNASLRQWTSNSASVQIQVSAPSSSSTGAATGSASSGSASSSSAPLSSAPLPEAAQASDSRDDALNETVTETVAGKVYSVESNGFLSTSEELGKIVGTTDQVVFWSGSSSSSPDYSWTFVGDEVDGAASLEFDPTITVSELGTGYVSNVMKQSQGGLVLEFAHDGALPGTASIYVKAEGVFSDGQSVRLFCFNEDERRFEAVEGDDLRVEGGYVSFKIDHCSTLALSADDLASYSVEEVNTPRAIAADEPVGTEQGWAVPAAVVVVVLAVVGAMAAVAVARRRRRAAVLAAHGDGDSSDQVMEGARHGDGENGSRGEN